MKMNEATLRQYIRKVVRESIFDEIAGLPENTESDKKEDEKPKDSVGGKKGRMTHVKDVVIKTLKEPETDCAPFAYELWPEKDKDSARSYFYKCRDGKSNENGSHYTFTDDEFNAIYKMLNNGIDN